MKDILKAAVVFGLIYFFWNVFWRSVFISWDVIGVPATFLLLAFLWELCFGEREAKNQRKEIAQGPGAPAVRTQAAESTTGNASLRGHSPVGSEASPRALGSVPQRSDAPLERPEEVSPTSSVDDYVKLVSEVRGLEDRCAEVWNRSLEQRRTYRELRRKSLDAAREFVESEREKSEPDETLIVDLDSFFDRLCAMYWGAESERRKEIRGLMESHRRLLRNLHSYAGRAAQRLRKTQDPEFLMRGLAAVSIDDERSGHDHGFVLGQLFLAALTGGVNPSPYFQTAADMSGTEPDGVRNTLETFDRSRDFKIFVEPHLRSNRF